MALSNQIHVYLVDTDDFYTENEFNINKKLMRYKKYKTIFNKFDKNKYLNDNSKKKKYKILESKINNTIKETKSKLKAEFLKNDRSPRILNPKRINDKKIISVFESTLTRTFNMEINQLSTDIMIVQTYYFEVIEQLIKNGYVYNGVKYRYYSSSAGQIRKKKAVFVKEELWNKYEKTLMCGLTIDRINELGGINVNKFLAYLALSNSATDLWKDFDIDKCIVVKDFETNVTGEVDYISDVTYKIIRQEMSVPITHTDGCGMILPKISKKNFMVRLPWIKGLLASFDFVKFIKEYNCSPIVKDIYGKEWNIIEDDIHIIFTESQFKMHKYYANWDEYKAYFKMYNCQAAICNLEEDVFTWATINYQMMQTLTDITDDELQKLISYSKNKLYNLARDKKTMLEVFGVVDSNENKTYLQQALEIYPELLQDEHCKHILRELKNSLVKRYKAAKLDVYGKYTFIIPDLYAFCEHIFCGIENPKGLLENGQVYCKLFKNVKKLDCLRSPHLFAEHAIRNNVIDKEKAKWFKTDAIYTSCHDLISKILQFDVDGDKSLVIADEYFLSIIERNMKNYNAVPLYYEMKKAQPEILNPDSIWRGLNAAFSGANIGIYSNNISKIWNSDIFISGSDQEKQEALDVIKLLCMENNFIIDYAKTLYKPQRPSDIDIIIRKYINGKLPYFFIYAKDKKIHQVKPINNSLVNRLNKEFKNTPLKFDVKNFGKLNYKYLMSNSNIEIDDNVIDIYKKLNREYHFKLNQKNQGNVNYITKQIREKLLSLNYSETEITDMLVKYLYSIKKTPYKEILWSCFGCVIVNNLKNNVPLESVQCEKCGDRFIPNYPNRKLCDKCNTYQPIGTKTIICVDCKQIKEIPSTSRQSERCLECYKLYRRKYKTQKDLERYHKNKVSDNSF